VQLLCAHVRVASYTSQTPLVGQRRSLVAVKGLASGLSKAAPPKPLSMRVALRRRGAIGNQNELRCYIVHDARRSQAFKVAKRRAFGEIDPPEVGTNLKL